MNNGCRLRLSATQGMTINRIINRVSPGYHYTTYGHNRCLLGNNIITLLILNQIKLLAESDFYTRERERDKKFSSLCSEKCVIVDPWDPLLILQTRALSLSPLLYCYLFVSDLISNVPAASPAPTLTPGGQDKELITKRWWVILQVLIFLLSLSQNKIESKLLWRVLLVSIFYLLPPRGAGPLIVRGHTL